MACTHIATGERIPHAIVDEVLRLHSVVSTLLSGAHTLRRVAILDRSLVRVSPQYGGFLLGRDKHFNGRHGEGIGVRVFTGRISLTEELVLFPEAVEKAKVWLRRTLSHDIVVFEVNMSQRES